MWKLNEDTIGRIQSYHEDFSNTEIANDLWINRKTVAKYRNLQKSTQQQAMQTLDGTEEKMRLNKKKEELIPKLSKEEKKKLELLKSYSDKDVKEMLNYIATSTKKEIDKVIGIPGHLRFWLIGDTHIWARECDLDALHRFYEDAKAEWVECVLHAWDLVDWCHVYNWQQFEQSEIWMENQIDKVVKDYPNIGVPTYFIGGNHDQSYLKTNWADVCKAISWLRDDLVNLGYYDATINLNWIKVQLQHWAWGTSYSPDYKLLRYIDSIQAWQEPDIFALGHYHRAIQSLHRWIHGFMPGAFLKSNLLAKRFRFPNIIGWWIIDITKDEDGRKKLTATFINE